MSDVHLFGDVWRTHVDDDATSSATTRWSNAFCQQLRHFLLHSLLLQEDIDKTWTCYFTLKPKETYKCVVTTEYTNTLNTFNIHVLTFKIKRLGSRCDRIFCATSRGFCDTFCCFKAYEKNPQILKNYSTNRST